MKTKQVALSAEAHRALGEFKASSGSRTYSDAVLEMFGVMEMMRQSLAETDPRRERKSSEAASALDSYRSFFAVVVDEEGSVSTASRTSSEADGFWLLAGQWKLLRRLVEKTMPGGWDEDAAH